jgi:hypothetical protein
MRFLGKSGGTILKALGGAAVLGMASKVGEDVIDQTGISKGFSKKVVETAEKAFEFSADALMTISGYQPNPAAQSQADAAPLGLALVPAATPRAARESKEAAPLGGLPPVRIPVDGDVAPAPAGRTPIGGASLGGVEAPLAGAAPIAGARKVCPHEIATMGAPILAGPSETVILEECKACGDGARDIARHQRDLTLGWAQLWNVPEESKATVPAIDDPKFKGPIGFLGAAFYTALAGWQHEQLTNVGAVNCGPQPRLGDYQGFNNANTAGKGFQSNLDTWNRCRSGRCGAQPVLSNYQGYDNMNEATAVFQKDLDIWTACSQRSRITRRRPEVIVQRGGMAPGVPGYDATQVVMQQQPGYVAAPDGRAGVGQLRRRAAQARAALEALRASTATQIQALKDQVRLTAAKGGQEVLRQKIHDLESQQGAIGTLTSQMVQNPQAAAVLALQEQLAAQAAMGPQAVLSTVGPALPMLVQQMQPGRSAEILAQILAQGGGGGSPEVPWNAIREEVHEDVQQDLVEMLAVTQADDDDDEDGYGFGGVVDPELNQALGLGGSGASMDDAIAAYASAGAGWDPETLALEMARGASLDSCDLGSCQGV